MRTTHNAPKARSGFSLPPQGQASGKLGDAQFEQLSSLVSSHCGIKLPPAKRTMLESRLGKRLRALGLTCFDQYCSLLFDQGRLVEELPRLLDVVTTNTTEFFREPRHYEVLTEKVLKEWRVGCGGQRQLQVWSAGCSSGEEPYTLAMVLEEYARQQPQVFDYRILASDISHKVLRHAVNAVYPEDRVSKIPLEIKRRYFLRSKDRARREVRIAQHVRDKVNFLHLNFLDDFEMDKQKDVIFCRNVLIYFDRDLQEKIVRKLCGQLRKGGVLFIGHSESLTGMNLPLKPIVPTVYRHL